jgi:hypothetical protein
MAGYSGAPLAQKLGIKPATTVTVINEPASYRKLLGEWRMASSFWIGSDMIRLSSIFLQHAAVNSKNT